MSDKRVIILGAGLSGLYLARRLEQLGYAVRVLEARERVGGRILSQPIDTDPRARVDLGPAWVWPQMQPRLSRLMEELGIEVFAQSVDGDSLVQGPDGRVQRHPGPSPHSQSYRIVGGAQSLVEVLAANLSSPIHLDTTVQAIDADAQIVSALTAKGPIEFNAAKVVSTLPLRLLAETIRFTPAIDGQLRNAWQGVPTWMAGHCKLLFLYPAPFWREQGLSGEAFSQRGPLTEIYDGTPYADNGEPQTFALTSFVGLNAHQRRQIGEAPLIEASLAQLEQLFGPQARAVDNVIVKDWSAEARTTTDADLSGAHQHPHYAPALPRQVLDGYLALAGTEVAPEYGGIIEGALESVDEILHLLT